MEWIQVSKRLPNDNSNVFVTSMLVDRAGVEQRFVQDAYYGPDDGDDWKDTEIAWRTYNDEGDGFYETPKIEQGGVKVIAWMPYPEPYQGG